MPVSYTHLDVYKRQVQCDDEELLHRIIDTYQKILLHFDGGITKQVYRFCESLSEAARVYIFALGSSACAAREFKLRFMRLGLLVEIIDNPHLMQMQAVLTKPEDLVIGMSISGETEAVLDALRTAGLHHTETVLITACRKQHFQEQFGQILTVPAVEGPVSYTHLDVYKRQWYSRTCLFPYIC